MINTRERVLWLLYLSKIQTFCQSVLPSITLIQRAIHSTLHTVRMHRCPIGIVVKMIELNSSSTLQVDTIIVYFLPVDTWYLIHVKYISQIHFHVVILFGARWQSDYFITWHINNSLTDMCCVKYRSVSWQTTVQTIQFIYLFKKRMQVNFEKRKLAIMINQWLIIILKSITPSYISNNITVS